MIPIARQPTLRSSMRHLSTRTPTLRAQRYSRLLPTRPLTSLVARRIPSATAQPAIRRRYSSTPVDISRTTKACPHCGTRLPLAASPCPKCSQLVPIPTDVSYYSLFDLTPPPTASSSAPHSNQERIQQELKTLEGGGYVLDLRDLRTRFFKRQQGCHPDSFTGQGKIYDLALDQSSFINKAYSTLVDPLSRAQYLLEIYGNPIGETDSLDDPDLLMEVMEAREELEEASTEEEVERVKASNAEHIKHAMHGLAQAFSADPPDLARAKSLAIEMQYLKNLERAAREWQPGKRVEVVH